MTAGWAEGLGTLAGATSFPLVTSLVIKGGFACLDAWLRAAPFSLEVSLGRGKGLAGPCNFSLVAYFPLSTVSARIGSLGVQRWLVKCQQGQPGRTQALRE